MYQVEVISDLVMMLQNKVLDEYFYREKVNQKNKNK